MFPVIFRRNKGKSKKNRSSTATNRDTSSTHEVFSLSLSPELAAIAANTVKLNNRNLNREEDDSNHTSEQFHTLTLSPHIASVAANVVRHQTSTNVPEVEFQSETINLSPGIAVIAATTVRLRTSDQFAPDNHTTDRADSAPFEYETLVLPPEIAARAAEAVTIIPEATVISADIDALPVVPTEAIVINPSTNIAQQYIPIAAVDYSSEEHAEPYPEPSAPPLPPTEVYY